LVTGILQMAPTSEQKREARQVLLGLLANDTEGHVVVTVTITTLTQLGPTVSDLTSVKVGWIPSSGAILGIIRRNSTFDQWLAALPLLAPLSNRSL
jgi:hypothetical protein